jgi:tetratricopeptide (TPR) repeat protein
MKPRFRNISKAKRMANNPFAEQTQAKFQQALGLHQKGQLAQAQALYEDILKTQPEHFDSLHLLGVIAFQRSDHQKAVDLIGKAIAIRPDVALAYCNRGLALQELKQLDAALASYGRAIAIKPDYAEAHANQGNALQELKQLDAAIASYGRATAIKPDYADAYFNCGLALKKLNQLDRAVASYDRAIASRPDFAEAYCNRGLALEELKQFDHAVASYDRAIAVKPDYAEAYSNRGNALQELAQLDAAISSYDRAIAIKPDLAVAHYNRGLALHELTRLDAAVASYDRAIAIRPDYAEAQWNKSLALLLGGNLDNGFELFEWRWKGSSLASTERNFAQPLWLGKESLAGKTILLHGEQGFGDVIQFCRYARLVADLGARVIMEVAKPLANLMKELAGVSELVIKGDALPQFDYQCPLLSLPLAFKTGLNSIPNAEKYLNVDTSKQAHWAGRLGEKTTRRVGVVWSGSTTHKKDHGRSILLANFMQLMPADYQYVSLQKEVRGVDRPAIESHTNIRYFGEELNDFADTAALCDLMDVVISVDTSVAHLGGALGKQTWVLLPFSPDWRWLLDRDTSPWYPTARLFRQQKIGDWGGVMERVSQELQLGNGVG